MWFCTCDQCMVSEPLHTVTQKKFHKLFVYAVLQHRSQAAICTSPFSSASLPSSRSGNYFCPLLCLLFPGGFSEYIRHIWQHSILLDQTINMNFAPYWKGTRLPVARLGKDKVSSFGFCISLQCFHFIFRSSVYMITYKGITEQHVIYYYVVLSAGQRACKDRTVPRLRSISDRA